MHAQYGFEGILRLEFIERDMGAKDCEPVGGKSFQTFTQPDLLIFPEPSFIAAGAFQSDIIHHDKTDSAALEGCIRGMNDTRIRRHVPRLAFHVIDVPVVIARHAGPGIRQRIEHGPGGSQQGHVVIYQVAEKNGHVQVETPAQFIVNRSARVVQLLFIIHLGVTHKRHPETPGSKREHQQRRQQ